MMSTNTIQTPRLTATNSLLLESRGIEYRRERLQVEG
jgi:hypothetical protein